MYDYRVLILFVGILLTMGCQPAEQGDSADNKNSTIDLEFSADSPLISMAQVEQVRSHDDVCLIEVGQHPNKFDRTHIPGAQFVHWITDITDPSASERYNIISRPAMESLLRKLGITHQTRVIIYDRLNSRLSTRMYWSLKYYQHPKVQVMNGSFETWARKYSPSHKRAEPTPSQYVIEGANPAIITNKDFIEKHLDDASVKLVDGRPAKQYNGKAPGKVFHTGKSHKNRGHIPGAVNVAWEDNFNDDGTFKTLEQLQELYSAQGVTTEQTVISYCNEGLHAATPWFVLSELLEYPDVRLYDDSMSEWGNSDQPTEVGDLN